MLTIRELIEILNQYDPLTLTDISREKIQWEYNNLGFNIKLKPENTGIVPLSFGENRIFDIDEGCFI